MSRIKGKNSKPEIRVRKAVHAMGFRFRLHKKDLPGKPDIVLPRHRKIIFIHGCFWHQHENCRYAYQPKTNPLFWRKKWEKNKLRDHKNKTELNDLGWEVHVIWECETKNQAELISKLKQILKKSH